MALHILMGIFSIVLRSSHDIVRTVVGGGGGNCSMSRRGVWICEGWRSRASLIGALFSVIGVTLRLFWLGILRQAFAQLKTIEYSWPNFN